jgi:hypothetical protein
MHGSGRESWTLLGDDGQVVEAAERYLGQIWPRPQDLAGWDLDAARSHP